MNFDNDKKYLILEKVKDMIITDGYSNLSISKLTSEINISKGSFYTYFPSKDKMLSEILDEYIENIIIFKNICNFNFYIFIINNQMNAFSFLYF